MRALMLSTVALAFVVSAPFAAGQTQFAELVKHPLPKFGAIDVALGDVDRDGDLDVVFAGSRLYLNDGNGKFTDVTASHLPKLNDFTWTVALGDVDGDSDLDLVFGKAWAVFGLQNQLYLNDGTGKFTSATASNFPKDSDTSLAVAVGDVDVDGDLDVFFGNWQQNRLYLNDGQGKFTDATTSRMPKVSDDTQALVVGDVDGDGDLDLIVGNGNASGGRQNRLCLNDGQGKFTDVTSRLPKVSDNTHALALGDVNGDGDLDLVVGNFGQNRLYLNDGQGKFTDATTSRLPKVSDNTHAVALGDVDGDRDLDLVVGNTRQNWLYLNDGKGWFTDATASRWPKVNYANALGLGDVDGDDDLDLVVGNTRQNRLYLNLHRHVYSPLLAQLAKPYQLDYYAKPGYATAAQVAVPFVNLAPQQPPIKVPRFGSFGLSLVGLIVLPPVGIAFPKGKTSAAFTFPNNSALVGKTLYVQALTVHRATPVDAHFTNVIADLIN